jgi:hypothetical protein
MQTLPPIDTSDTAAVVAWLFAPADDEWTQHTGSGDVAQVYCTDGRACAKPPLGLPKGEGYDQPARIPALTHYYRRNGKAVCSRCARAAGHEE